MGKKTISEAALIPTAEVARLLGRSPQAIREYARRGLLPALAIGRDWLFRPADVAAFAPPKMGRPKNGGK